MAILRTINHGKFYCIHDRRTEDIHEFISERRDANFKFGIVGKWYLHNKGQ